MKVLRLALVGFLLLGLCSRLATAADTARTVQAKHSAWELTGTNCSVYLLGSVHVMKDEHYPLPGVFESAFSNSAIVVFETDVGAMMKPEAQMKLMQQAMLPDGETLKDHLSRETYTALKRRLESSGVPEFMLLRLKPGVAMMTLVVLEAQRLGFKAEQGMDLYFYNRAKKQGKQIVGLESLDFQIGLLCNLTDREGESVVKSTLEDLDDAKEKFEEMLSAWQAGDESGLEKMLNESNRQEPALMKKLITDRNVSWIADIEKFAQSGTNTAVVVGAGHLVGKGGVVDLLRGRGWRVVQE